MRLFKFFCITTFFISTFVHSQKKVLDHNDVALWNVIKNQSISNDGNYILYHLEKDENDTHLKIKSNNGNLIFEQKRALKGSFSYDSKYTFFTITPWKDSILELKRKKVKDDKLPKDTLAIFNLETKEVIKYPNLNSVNVAKEWTNSIAYYTEEVLKSKSENDSTKKKKKPKKVNKENGFHLVAVNLNTKTIDTFKYVTNHAFSKDGNHLAFTTTGIDSIYQAGAYVYSFNTQKINHIHKLEKSKYYQLKFSESGKKLGFIADEDTTKIQIRPYKLYTWNNGEELAKLLLDNEKAPENFYISQNGTVEFSKDESKLYFGLTTKPILKDTLQLKEETVNVEVWTYNEPRLYTVQELDAKDDLKKSFKTVIHLNQNNKLVQLSTPEYPNSRIADKGNAPFALVSNPVKYQLEQQWTGRSNSDFAIVNIENGITETALTKVPSSVRISPKGKFIYGYHAVDSTWFVYNISEGKSIDLTRGKQFYNEINDYPNYPYSYGQAGWTENDDSFLLYDRYDIWEFNPVNGESKNLTNGRESKTVYRFIKLDTEEAYIKQSDNWLFSTFNEVTKNSGFASYNIKSEKLKQELDGPFKYSRIKKAKHSDQVTFTKESFIQFPDILTSDLNFKNINKVTNANPQQMDYNWGTAELVKWTSLDGMELTGMLYKPENFDSSKKYPMIVNFYEKSSDRLHNHRAPSYGRSTINYSFYLSRGYVIFNPDVYYRIGYPGESAFNCVIPGVTSLIEKGYIDKDRIGVQGHSWGGYQIAYLVTKTDIFKAAESGAPVPNMISAYGGIRWWTGLSRQFQYEHTQSRIGGTPWEYPQRYIENSPIFNIDKINTPLLIMHNDADGHVPWYQGIEFFVSLRRLGKPSWFLNYNEEPHWPLKLQNRKDFNIRMAQFFDYYLKDAPKPVWMERGVPAIEKGINQGLELIKN